jgi:hypothetical protein
MELMSAADRFGCRSATCSKNNTPRFRGFGGVRVTLVLTAMKSGLTGWNDQSLLQQFSSLGRVHEYYLLPTPQKDTSSLASCCNAHMPPLTKLAVATPPKKKNAM